MDSQFLPGIRQAESITLDQKVDEAICAALDLHDMPVAIVARITISSATDEGRLVDLSTLNAEALMDQIIHVVSLLAQREMLERNAELDPARKQLALLHRDLGDLGLSLIRSRHNISFQNGARIQTRTGTTFADGF